MNNLILLDCDGILADFSSAYLKLIEKHTGHAYNINQLIEWDHLKCLKLEYLEEVLKFECGLPGWCMNIKPYSEALENFKFLEEKGEVVILTSPMSNPNWEFERKNWLQYWFNIPKTRVISASGKYYIDGDFFIDDSADNCKKWQKRNNGKAFLWNRPWNSLEKYEGFRIDGWKELLYNI